MKRNYDDDEFKKDQFKIDMVNDFVLHLQTWRPNITVLEMVEIFGKDIAQMWQKIIMQTSTDVNLYNMKEEGELEALLADYQKCYNSLSALKEKLVKYSSEEMKGHVKKRLKDHVENPYDSKYQNREYFKDKKRDFSQDNT